MSSQKGKAINVSEISGIALDYAVGCAVKIPVMICDLNGKRAIQRDGHLNQMIIFSPSANWNDIGQLISFYEIWFEVNRGAAESQMVRAIMDNLNPGSRGFRISSHGATHQEAACRAIVQAVFGGVFICPIEILEVQHV